MLRVCIAAMLLFAFSGAAHSQEFEQWEGKQQVYEGEGGTRKTVDGVDFWSNGSPPRRFILIGYVTDRRHKSGLWGTIRMSSLFEDIAEVVKRVGGDAVIVLSAEAETTGAVGTGNFFTPPSGGNTWGSTTTALVQKQITRGAVIKYLVEEALPAPPPLEPTPLPPVNGKPVPN